MHMLRVLAVMHVNYKWKLQEKFKYNILEEKENMQTYCMAISLPDYMYMQALKAGAADALMYCTCRFSDLKGAISLSC